MFPRSAAKATVCFLILASVYLLFTYKHSDKTSSNPTFGGIDNAVGLPEPRVQTDQILKRSPAHGAQKVMLEEMSGYDFEKNHLRNSFGEIYTPTLDDLLIERGGQPIRALILTTWRSGSTFMGDILFSHPSTFYHYEPLLHYEINQVRKDNPKLAEDAIRVLKSLLQCKYDELGDYINYGRTHNWLFKHNERLWNHCLKGFNPQCWKPETLNAICALHPFQSIKTVRLRLNLVYPLLEDSSLRNVKVIHIVRDPRGTMQSRKHRDWCPGNPDCDQPIKLCADMVSDYYAAKDLISKYPDRFMAVRYEDFSMDPEKNARNVTEFLNFQFHPKVKEFLDSHTKQNIGGVSSTFRDSKKAPYHWIKDLTFTEVDYIQKNCEKAMSLWGYVPARDEEHLLELQPLTHFDL